MTPTTTNNESPSLPTKLVLSALNKDKIATQRTDAITRARTAGLSVSQIVNASNVSETHVYRTLQQAAPDTPDTPTSTPATQTSPTKPTPELIEELTATLQALDPYRITLLRRQAIYDARNPAPHSTDNPQSPAASNDASAAASLPWAEIATLLGMTRANCHVLYNQHLEGADFE